MFLQTSHFGKWVMNYPTKLSLSNLTKISLSGTQTSASYCSYLTASKILAIFQTPSQLGMSLAPSESAAFVL